MVDVVITTTLPIDIFAALTVLEFQSKGIQGASVCHMDKLAMAQYECLLLSAGKELILDSHKRKQATDGAYHKIKSFLVKLNAQEMSQGMLPKA